MSINMLTTRPRLIAAILIQDSLGYVSYKFSGYEYVGDPINCLSILSGFQVDEVLIVDKTASRSAKLNLKLLNRLRTVADYPLSYTGGIRSPHNFKQVMDEGFDKIYLNSNNSCIEELVDDCGEKYGKQSIGISYDYYLKQSERYMYDTKTREHTNILLSKRLRMLNKCQYSDILLTNVHQTGTLRGMDIDVMKEEIIRNSSNPIIVSGGLRDNGYAMLLKYKKIFPNLSGFASSSSIFQYSGSGTSLISLEKHY